MKHFVWILAIIALCLPAIARGQDKLAVRAAEAACGTGPYLRSPRVFAGSDIPPQIPPGDSLVYLINPAPGGTWVNKFTEAIAADGNWIAEIGGRSHIAIVMKPGPHHFCARIRQMAFRDLYLTGLLNIDLQPAHTYYIRAWATQDLDDLPVAQLNVLNSDEGQFLVAATQARSSEKNSAAGGSK